jgi:hypothetical protein
LPRNCWRSGPEGGGATPPRLAAGRYQHNDMRQAR